MIQHTFPRNDPSDARGAGQSATQAPARAPRTGLRALTARHPLALFLALAFGLGYPLMGLAILAQRGFLPGASLPGRFHISMEEAAALLLLLGALFPAAVAVTALEGGRPALRALGRRIFRWRVAPGWWLVVAAALPTLTVALAVALGDTVRLPGVGLLAQRLGALAVGFGLINLWEETAWAGFLQTRLERRHNFFLAAALTAIPFAAIHMPLQIINGITDPSDLAVTFALLAFLSCFIRTLLGAALRGTGDSLLAVGLLHTLFNQSNNPEGIAALFLDGPNRQTAAFFATILLAIALCLALRRRLGHAYRLELDARTIDAAPHDAV